MKILHGESEMLFMLLRALLQVLPDMTASTLSVCLSQAVTAYSPVPLDPIAGLFDQRDGIFYSLEYILSLPEPPLQYSFSVIRPLKREQPKKHSWSLVEIFLLIGVVATLIAAYFYGIDCLGYLWMILLELHYFLVDLPLRELYRYGPHLVGWEGLELAEVCSRITYYGNKDFWGRNTEECLSIYQGKEEAFLRIARPIAYSVFAIVAYIAVRHLIKSYAESKRNRTDRVVLETYNAFQTLVRLANRQVYRKKDD